MPVRLYMPVTAWLSVVVASGAMCASTAKSQELPGSVRVTVGAQSLVTPKFEGSKTYVFSALPVFQLSPIGFGTGGASRLDFRSLDEISFSVIRAEGLEIGPSLGYRKSREESNSPRLAGLGDVDGGLVAGGFARYNFGPMYVRAGFTQQVTGSDTGYLVRLAAGARHALTPQLTIRGVTTLEFASEDHMQTYFGVTPAQSLRSGLAAFDAGAGLKSVGAMLSTEYAVTENWKLLASAGYTRYLNDAASSPITESADRFEGRLGASRSFDWKLGKN